MAQQKEVWELQLMRYFITHKAYTQVKFVNTVKGMPEDMDIWLANPNATFSIIHITRNAQSFNNARIEQIRTQANSLFNVLRRSGQVLDISLDIDGEYIDNGEITSIVIYPGCKLPDKVLSSFPDLNLVVFDVDDPETEAGKLQTQVNDYAMKNNNVRQRQRREIIQSFSKTFIIAGAISIIVAIANMIITHVCGVSSVSASIFLGAYYKAFVVIFHDFWRLLTAGFGHGGFFHIWCNLIALYNVSKIVEDRMGFAKTMCIFLASVVFGNVCVLAGDGNIVASGLSGGIYGLFASVMILFWQAGYFKIPALRRNILSTVYINILINFLPNVSLLAHLGGFVTGLLLTFIFSEDSEKALKINSAISGVLIIVALIYFCYKNFYLDTIYLGTDYEVANIFSKIGLESMSKNIINMVTAYYGR